MARRRRHGRIQIDRAGVARLTGASYKTIVYWYSNRQRTGFPNVAEVGIHGRHWYWLGEVRTFASSYQDSKRFTTVDRAGHAEDLIGSPEAARVLGYRHRRSLPALLLDHPDHTETLPSGRVRRRWRRHRVWDFADTRHLRHSTGHPRGATGTRKPHWYTGDPRLLAAARVLATATASGAGTRGLAAQLANQLGTHPSTARRLLAVAAANRPGRHPGVQPRSSTITTTSTEVSAMRYGRYEPGGRVELVYTSDPDTRLRPGDRGTVKRQIGDVVYIAWDSGSGLAMCLDAGDLIRPVAT
jgi:hypothetical protein